MTVSLRLWNSTGNEPCGWQEATKLLEDFMSFQEAISELDGKAKKPTA
jgi:hypothetical protein